MSNESTSETSFKLPPGYDAREFECLSNCESSVEMTDEKLKYMYEMIAGYQDKQQEYFESLLKQYPWMQADIEKVKGNLSLAGFEINERFCLFYKPEFKPLELCYKICFVRHGKTEGNTEPRVFQGQVDYMNNRLNELGKVQAMHCAKQLVSTIDPTDGTIYAPDLILCSPLSRVKMTAIPYIDLVNGRSGNDSEPPIPRGFSKIEVCDAAGLLEMPFGGWDNKKVCDIEQSNFAHLFYLRQNVCVKPILDDATHLVDNNKCCSTDYYSYFRNDDFCRECCVEESGVRKIPACSFSELLLQTRSFLINLNNHPSITRLRKHKNQPKVLMFGHSMTGACVSLLLGHGKVNPANYGAISFDGPYIMPNATPTFLFPNVP